MCLNCFSGHYLCDMKCICAPVDKTLLYFFFCKVYKEYLVSTKVPPTKFMLHVYLSLEMD